MQKGLFISVEGGEGAGKTTVVDKIESTLRKRKYTVLRTREPGGVELAEQIRHLLLHTKQMEMDDRTEALLYAAARREHLVKKVLPALESGSIVLCDRFIDSSLVYQGYARGIGMEEVWKINQFAVEGHLPDLTLYFDVSPEVGLARVKKDQVRDWNRLDQETVHFHKKVEKGYKLLVESEQERIKVIQAERPFEEVYHQALMIIEDTIKGVE
ncbi:MULTISPECIES: dTMP kinase [Shouchella]|uniref:Thymidylate kinase n=3 Tax=Bacillaceae TaxID=186817 RepID=A0A060M3K0_9BACI|nr:MULTISPECIES: dTMP kinase [Bacillaceae]RQW18069.1 dTMP kinase [Bacillus sp. C1-1]AIC96575.1 thymidylate kinase [Shouchella lehensis G1]KQL51605.1 thymidylate kinase [Alkalicoccobacillus plakortidis]MBG9782414.1 thymidylate kinase [Shouchella lehensis]TES46846.1 dTMP kinase [Shouchella lehensis]